MNYYSSGFWAPSDYLMHHGILGQKWGIRRYQNADGTLTATGRSRINKNKKSLFQRLFDKSIEKSVSDDRIRKANRREEIKESVKKKFLEEDQEHIASIKKMGKDLGDESIALYPIIGKKLNSMRLDSKSKDNIIKSLKRDFGDGVDDEDLFDFYKEEYIGYEILEKLYKTKGLKEYKKHTEDYWGQVESYADDFIKRHADDKLSSYEVDTTYKNAIYYYLDTATPAYMYRHFDDYWICDRPEYTAAVDRMSKDISYKDVFNKYPGK